MQIHTLYNYLPPVWASYTKIQIASSMGSIHENEYKLPPVWAKYLLLKLIDGPCHHAPFLTLVYLFTCLLFILMVLATMPLSRLLFTCLPVYSSYWWSLPPYPFPHSCLPVYLLTVYIDGPSHHAPFLTLVYLFTCLLFILMVLALSTMLLFSPLYLLLILMSLVTFHFSTYSLLLPTCYYHYAHNLNSSIDPFQFL